VSRRKRFTGTDLVGKGKEMKKENLASAKNSAKKRAAKGLGNAGLATLSVLSAFVGWGYLSSLASSHPATAAEAQNKVEAKTAVSPKLADVERELILDEVKSASKPSRNTSRNASEENVLMNDPFIQNKWGLEKTHASKAWEITKGSKDIVIAVIDTGIDVNHRDLADNLWRNLGEMGLDAQGRDKATNGIDDDGNGFIDDVHGWNFVHNDHKLTDNHGHGTHIAGIIGAKGGNNFGISGVAPNVSLMILKYYDPKAPHTNNLKNTINAIRYAIKMKAHIINYSGGGTDYSAEEYEAVKEAERAGILFVAAAGNERSNTDEAGKHYYPADYELSNIISVTAVNKDEIKVLPSSNYGVRTVDLAAPGENIYSALPNNSFGFMTGTSQATAFVTGVAALVMSHNRDLDAAHVKKYILRTGDEYPSLLSKTGTAKLLNSYKALTTLDSGVGLTGVVASNTAKMGTRAFSSSSNPKSSNASNTSALNNTLDDTQEPAEAIAMFGRDFVRALEKSILEESADVRQR
jgi:thermitase